MTQVPRPEHDTNAQLSSKSVYVRTVLEFKIGQVSPLSPAASKTVRVRTYKDGACEGWVALRRVALFQLLTLQEAEDDVTVTTS